MPNIATVGFIEPFELIGSLKGRLPLFQGEGLRVLHLRAPRKSDPQDFADTRELSRWPELRAALERITLAVSQRFGDEPDYGRIYLEMLDANASVRARPGTAGFVRLILGLRCNPGAYLWCPPEQHILTPGELVLTNPALWHAAVNMGEFSRISLVIDVRLPERES